MEITSGQPTVQVGGGRDNGMWGGDGGLVFLAFLAMMGMGGVWGGNRGGQPIPNNIATTDTVNGAMQYSNLQQGQNNIVSEIQRSQNASLMFGADKYMELQRDVSGNALQLRDLAAQTAECCCTLRQEIANLNFENEKRFAALSSKMDQQEIQRLRDQLALQSQSIQDLKSDIRMQGVVRYPQSFVYSAGNSPFCCNNGGLIGLAS